MRRAKQLTEQMLAPVELLLLLTGLGGGAGTGASHALAAQAKQNGALVLSVAATPFEDQPARCDLAEGALPRLEEASDVCVRLSLDRLAWQARERGADWRRDASWVEELVQGIVLTLGRVGLINLDLMDLRAVVGHTGEATLLVAEGDATNPEALFRSALASPLAGLKVEGASGCLLQIEGGPRMTVAQVNSVADAFTRGFSDDSQVILGARMADELDGRMRVVAVVSGL
jgi:cell division protein FtsZ